MEPKVHLSNNGQAVNQDDFNAIGRQAALNAEYIWAQLLRTAPTGSGSSFTPVRGIIPSEGQIPIAAYSENYRKSLMGGSQANDAKITFQPFVAVIGSRSDRAATATGPHDEGTEGPRDALREIRLALHVGDGTKLETLIQVPAATNNRWDVFYAQVDIDTPDAADARFIKVGDGPVTATAVSVVDRTKVTIHRIGGVEATNPVKPAIPADGGGSYYILLGYYFVGAGHTLTSTITASRIFEAFTPILISPGNGGGRVCPANGAYRDNGYAWTVEQWSNARGQIVTHQSPNVTGFEERSIFINAEDSSGYASVAPNAVTVLDDSVDWRKRYFVTVLQAAPATGGGQAFPHAASSPSLFSNIYSLATAVKAMNSHVENMSGNTAAAATGYIVAWFDDTSAPSVATGAKMAIFVDQATGRLCVWRNNVDAGRRVIAFVKGYGRQANTDANGL